MGNTREKVYLIAGIIFLFSIFVVMGRKMIMPSQEYMEKMAPKKAEGKTLGR